MIVIALAAGLVLLTLPMDDIFQHKRMRVLEHEVGWVQWCMLSSLGSDRLSQSQAPDMST